MSSNLVEAVCGSEGANAEMGKEGVREGQRGMREVQRDKTDLVLLCRRAFVLPRW